MSGKAGTHLGARRGGFTLIELVVVVGVMALLVAITVVIGAGVVERGRANKTRDAIQALNVSLTEYYADRSSGPPTMILEPNDQMDQDLRKMMPVADAVFDIGHTEPGSIEPTPRLINSVGLYIKLLEESPGALKGIQSLSEEFLQLRPIYTPTSDSDLNTGDAKLGKNGDHAGIPTVIDGWGRPIRYVHPRFDGQIGELADDRSKGSPGTTYLVRDILQSVDPDELGVIKIRRNKIDKSEYTDIGVSQRDSDGSMSPSDRPYFYSAGKDGDPSTIEDNVYTSKPVFTDPDFVEK